MMKLKHPRLSRHFSPRWWLCQAISLLGLVSLLIRKSFNHPRLLITHVYALKIDITHRSCFVHLNYTIPSLICCRNLTFQEHIQDASYLCFFRLIACNSQQCSYASKLHVVSCGTMISPLTTCPLVLTYVLWELGNTKCAFLHCYIFLACWFTQLGFSRTKPSWTWVNQCIGVCIGNITSHN